MGHGGPASCSLTPVYSSGNLYTLRHRMAVRSGRPKLAIWEVLHMSRFLRIAPVLIAAAAAPVWAEDKVVTFNKDVAPIVFQNCASCHRPGEIGPFSLLDYESARPWAKSIRQAVAERKMPPWEADSTKTKFLHDRTLKQADV